MPRTILGITEESDMVPALEEATIQLCGQTISLTVQRKIKYKLNDMLSKERMRKNEISASLGNAF